MSLWEGGGGRTLWEGTVALPGPGRPPTWEKSEVEGYLAALLLPPI